MINLFDLKIDTQLFDKFIFHNGRPECMNVKLFNDLINYEEHIDYDDGKIHIWYVRNDDGLPDFIYNNDEEKIRKVLPKNIIEDINQGKLKLLFGTDSEWEYDGFWMEVFKYVKEVGIKKDKINLMTSNFKTSLTEYNTHSFKFSSISDIRFDLGLFWKDMYGDFFPYTDDFLNQLITHDKSKKFICMNAHYNEHRHYVVYKLLEKKLFDLGHVSFTLGQGANYVEHSKDRMIMEWNRMIESGDFEIGNYDLSINMLDKLPFFIKEFGLENPKDFWKEEMKIKNPILKEITPSIRPWMIRDIDLIKDTYFCLGVETQVNSDEGNFGNFSEKVMIGWITQPTIIVGTAGIISHLKGLGFESYSEMFDESYDDILDTDRRLTKVMNEVERICKLNEDDLKSIYKDLLPKVVHNQQKIFEYDTITDWSNLLESLNED